MKICIIANGYPNRREPQFGCFERDQAIALSKLGHEVSILYVDGRFRTYWRPIGITKKKDNGLDVYGLFIMPMKWGYTRWTCRLLQLVEMKLLDKLYRCYENEHGKPDVIYAHYMWNISYATILKRKYNIPLVGIEHWSGLTVEKLTLLARFWGNIAYSNVNKLLAVSESLRNHIIRHFQVDSIVVNDMLGPEFLSKPANTRINSDSFTFISVGNLLPIKCYDLLVESFANSCLAEKGSKLLIIGDGTEKGYLQATIAKYGLQEAVLLVGRKNKQEIKTLLYSSHAYVLSSKAETFGVACIEALSQGLPVIATACGGPEEIVNDRNGMLVPVGDTVALSSAMTDMYNNADNYDRDYISIECLKRFAPESIAKKLIKIFEELK